MDSGQSGWRKGIGRGQGISIEEEDMEDFAEIMEERPRPPPAAGTEVQGLHNLPCRAARSTMGYGGPAPAPRRPAPTATEGDGAPKKNSKKKMNGYLLFAIHKRKQIERETGKKLDKPMDQILRMFDEDWRNLGEDEKVSWKDRAKGPIDGGACGGGDDQGQSGGNKGNEGEDGW